jgi:peptidoglycan/LPS O-acetylase OafA/YrhL
VHPVRGGDPGCLVAKGTVTVGYAILEAARRILRGASHGLAMNAAMPAVPAAIRPPERFEILDLWRGIAALAVLIYHTDHFLGMQLLPNAYLAVDMFFMLSGFVIAHNYDRKISSGMTLKGFMLQRAIRLYPCYWLALLLGFVFSGARMIRDGGYVDGFGLVVTGLCNLLMLPSVVPLYGSTQLFPFNGATWSLMYELIANVAYWLTHRFLNTFNLIALLVVSAVCFVLAGRHIGTVDLGMRNGEALLAIPRVMFSFFAGVALRRYAHDAVRVRLGTTGVAVAVAVLIATFCFSEVVSWRLSGEFVVILLVFPLLLLCSSNTVPGPRLAPLCRLAGNTSYPVYILQTPLGLFFAAIPELFFHRKGMNWAPTYGIVEVVVVVVLAWWVDRHFELPARKMLKSYLVPEKRVAVGAGG